MLFFSQWAEVRPYLITKIKLNTWNNFIALMFPLFLLPSLRQNALVDTLVTNIIYTDGLLKRVFMRVALHGAVNFLT